MELKALIIQPVDHVDQSNLGGLRTFSGFKSQQSPMRAGGFVDQLLPSLQLDELYHAQKLDSKLKA